MAGDTIDLANTPHHLGYSVVGGNVMLDQYAYVQMGMTLPFGPAIHFSNTLLGDLQVQNDGHGGTAITINNDYQYLIYQGVSTNDPTGWVTNYDSAALPAAAPNATDTVVFGATAMPAGVVVPTSGTVGSDFSAANYMTFESGGAWTLTGDHAIGYFSDNASSVAVAGQVTATTVSFSGNLIVSGTLDVTALSSSSSSGVLLTLRGPACSMTPVRSIPMLRSRLPGPDNRLISG